jgi:hypothetical protein
LIRTYYEFKTLQEPLKLSISFPESFSGRAAFFGGNDSQAIENKALMLVQIGGQIGWHGIS